MFQDQNEASAPSPKETRPSVSNESLARNERASKQHAEQAETAPAKLDPMFRSDWKPTREYKRKFYWEPTYSDEPAKRRKGPTKVNAKGDIVGASENGQIDPLLGINQARAVLWKDGHITDLGSLGGYESIAFGINNHEQIVGISTNTIPDPYCGFPTQNRVFLWQNGQMQDLGTLGGNCALIGLVDTTLGAINERGQVVGASTTSSIPNPVTGIPPWDPFLWEEGKGMTDLGTLGGVFGAASSINNRGQVIGQSSIAADPGACNGFPDNDNSNCHAFLWERGTLTDLTTSSIGGNPSFVAGIDDAGEIIGSGAFPNAASDAFLWRNGVATDLGHLGDCYSSALAINCKSQVVGFTLSCDGTIHRAFLWGKGSMIDLNTLIPPGSSLQLAVAMDINDRGEIDGIGVPPGVPVANWVTQGHEFLLIPCDDASLSRPRIWPKELASFYHVASIIVNADHCIM